MKNLICLLLLYCCATSSAFSRDAAEKSRERLIFCSQFVIEDPGPVVVLDSTHDCCGFANAIHDCHLIKQGEKHH